MAKTDVMTQINSTAEYNPTYSNNIVGIPGTNMGLKIKADYINYKLTATPIKMSKYNSDLYMNTFLISIVFLIPLLSFTALILIGFTPVAFRVLLAIAIVPSGLIFCSLITDKIIPLTRKSLIKSLPEEFTPERLKKNAELFSEASALPEATFELKIIEDASEILRQYEEFVTKQNSSSQNLSNRVAEEKTDLFENVFKNKDSENSKD